MTTKTRKNKDKQYILMVDIRKNISADLERALKFTYALESDAASNSVQPKIMSMEEIAKYAWTL